jgi:hypothetical protein
MKTMAVMLSMVFGVALAGGALLAVFGSSPASAGTTCSIYWTGKTGQTWSTASNWSLTNGGAAASRTPTATDYVCMSTAPTHKTVSLTTSEAVGGINWPQTATVSPSLTDSGSLTIGNHTTSYASTIDNLTVSGSLAGTATLTVPSTGTLTLIGGTLTGVRIVSQGTATQTGTTYFNAGSTLENAGSLALADSSDLYDADNNASNLFQNDLGGTLTYSSTNSTYAIIYVPWSNAGTVDVAGNSTLDSYGTFDNTNSVNVAGTSTLYLAQGNSASHSDTGSYNVVAGALLNIAGGTRTIGAGASFTGAGQVAVNGTLALSHATSFPNLLLDGGTLEGPATATIPSTGTLTLTGGTLTGAHIVNQGAATQTGTTYFNAGSTLENAGSLALADSSDLYDADNNASNLFQNDLGGTLTYSSTNSTYAIIYVPWSNAGTVDVAGNSTLDSYGTFDNTNSVNVAGTSTLYLAQGNSASHSDTGSYNVVAGALLNIAGGTRTIGAGAVHRGGHLHRHRRHGGLRRRCAGVQPDAGRWHGFG